MVIKNFFLSLQHQFINITKKLLIMKQIHNFLPHVMYLLFLLLPMVAMADENGTCGENLTCNMGTGTL